MQRSYRQTSLKNDEVSFQILVEESDLWITLGTKKVEPSLINHITSFVLQVRADIQNAILMLPEFQTSLVPIEVPAYFSTHAKAMAAAAKVMSVGPMATVAGLVAEALARELHGELHGNSHAELDNEAQYKFSDVIVENGGDTFMFTTKERVVGLLPDPKSKAIIGVLVKPEGSPVSFCSSSGRFGHSLSLGNGDLAVIRAGNAALADAAATAICNMLKSAKDVEKAIARVKSLQNQGLDGAFVQCAGKIGIWGNMELAEL